MTRTDAQRAALTGARAWIADTFNDVDAAELTDMEVVAGIARHYAGGWEQFHRDGTPHDET